MISRAQRILFAVMLIAVVIMSAILIRLRERAQDRLHTVQDSTPLAETTESASQTVKARVLLETLLETFRDSHSTHPIAPSTADESSAAAPSTSTGIDDVFLMPVPHAAGSQGSGTLAVVDFSAAFAASHPSGIEPETLTLLAILGTLHANIPAITQVRFLIDGHPADTLAGHADLTRTYLTADTTTGTQQQP
jgi:hypothetical protein